MFLWLENDKCSLESGPLVRTEAKEGLHTHTHTHGSRIILSLRHCEDLLVDKQEESSCTQPRTTFSTAPQLSMTPVCVDIYWPRESIKDFESTESHIPKSLNLQIT